LKPFGENHPNVATSYNNIGSAYVWKGEYEKAIEYYSKALTLLKKGNSRQETIWGAKYLGRVCLEIKNYPLAASSFEDAVSVIENARHTMGAGKTDFMSRNIDAYYYLLKTRALMNDPEKTFAVAEAMRSRGFLDRLSLSAALSVPGIAAADRQSLLALNDSIETLSAQRAREIQKPEKEQNRDTLVALGNELDAKEKAFAALDASLMKNDKYAQMRKPKIASLADARKLCGKDKAIIEYVIWEGDEKEKQSYALVITSAGMKTVPLDPAFAYSDSVSAYRDAILSGNAESGDNLSAVLYEKLISPVEKDLEGISQTVIVPDGALAFLPFDSLRKDASSPYLCEKTALSLQSSVSVMMMVHNRDYSAETRLPLLAFGGAAYDPSAKGDDRGGRKRGIAVKEKSEKLREYEASLGVRAYYDAQEMTWPNLPGTKAEVETISSDVFKGEGTTLVTGKNVTEEAVKSFSTRNKLKGYKAVHLACHGYYNPVVPGFSSVIFSEAASKTQAKEDGYLTVEETALLDLNADMVVLSACETGIGKVVKGDGIVGLTRALNVAGANSVGVTLWTVDDNATRLFMVSVYRKMKEQKISFARAAYLTKIDFLKKRTGEDYSSPYFWSPFVVYGE
jgi:CHAT domain-containing protein